MSLKLYRNKAGEKLYPVCNWENNQHKVYNALDRINCAIIDAEADDEVPPEAWNELLERREEIEEALSAFNRYIVNGLVYATYKESNLIKDIVWEYNARG